MNAACIYPYEIVEQCVRPKLLTERQVLDATWNSLPDYTDHRNAIAVVDSSGSMYAGIGEVPGGGLYSPISVAVSLGMYFAEHNKGAFHNKFITFSERPRLIEIKGNDVYEKVKYCMSYNEVANTDLYQVFMLLLITAVKTAFHKRNCPKRFISYPIWSLTSGSIEIKRYLRMPKKNTKITAIAYRMSFIGTLIHGVSSSRSI